MLIPKSARTDYQFWKSLDGLTVEDMTYLITVRIRDLKYTQTYEEQRILRTQIAILRDAIKITRQRHDLSERLI